MEQKKLPGRMVLNTTDIQNATGMSKRSAQRLLQKIRLFYGKESAAEFVTIEEFCAFSGVKPEDIQLYIIS